MFEICRRVEQLEVVGHLLDQGTASSARLAVIVADNFAEIVLHDRARYEFAKEQSYLGFRQPRWSPEKRHKVMDDFGKKVGFLTSEINAIDEDEAKFFNFGHSVRNRAYHADAYHGDVIGPVARTYFGKLCRLYPRLRIPGVSHSNTKTEAAFLERYGLSQPLDLINGGLERICDSLASARDCKPADLAAALSKNLVTRIDAITGTKDESGFLETLLDGKGEDDAFKDDMLKGIQFTDTYEPSSRLVKTDEEFREAIERRTVAFAGFTAPITLEKLHRWRATASTISADVNPGEAAERFRSLDEQFSPLEDLVHEAVHEFDEWVNSQV